MEDIKFIRDDSFKRAKQQLDEIFEVVRKDVKKEKEIIAGERFMRAVFLASRNFKPVEIPKPKDIILAKIEQKLEEIKPKEELKDVEVNVEEIKQEEIIPEIEFPVTYPLLSSQNGVLVRVIINDISGEVKYNLYEPEIDAVLKDKVSYEITRKYKKQRKIVEDDKLINILIKKVCKKYKIEYKDIFLDIMKYYLYRDLVSFQIQVIMHDPNIDAIICEGKDKAVYVEHKSFGRINTNIVFWDNEDINKIIERIALRTNSVVSEEKPILNTLLEGFRVQANYGRMARFVIKRER